MVKSRNAERGEDNGTSATDASGSRSVGGAVCGQRWKRKKKSSPAAGPLVAVELAIRKSPTEPEASCGLAVVLAGGRRIEVRRDFDTQALERLVSVLERV